MPRTRKSAKAAGTRFERSIADHLAATLDDRIDRQVKRGARDRGDIANVRDSHGRKITIEAKDYGGRLVPTEWVKEAHREAENAGAYAGVVVAKRKGVTAPGKQWCVMTVDDLTRLLT